MPKPETLIDPERYFEIRAALLVSLGPENLPNEIIEADIYLGEADRWVRSQLKDLTGIETNPAAANAEIYMTAALLATSIDNVTQTRETTGETVSMEKVDWQAKEGQLRARAEQYIVAALYPDGSPNPTIVSPPQFFSLAHGRRGR